MQWDQSPNAGFSPVDPSLPMTEDFRSDNVENARRDGTSIYKGPDGGIIFEETRGAIQPIISTGM